MRNLFLTLAIFCTLACNERQALSIAASGWTALPTTTLWAHVSDSMAMRDTWVKFCDAVLAKSYPRFTSMSFDTIAICDSKMPVARFFKNCFTDVFDSTVARRMTDSSFYFMLVYPEKQVQIVKEKNAPDGGPWTLTFNFRKTPEGFRFYRCDSYGGPRLCRQRNARFLTLL